MWVNYAAVAKKASYFSATCISKQNISGSQENVIKFSTANRSRLRQCHELWCSVLRY